MVVSHLLLFFILNMFIVSPFCLRSAMLKNPEVQKQIKQQDELRDKLTRASQSVISGKV